MEHSLGQNFLKFFHVALKDNELFSALADIINHLSNYKETIMYSIVWPSPIHSTALKILHNIRTSPDNTKIQGTSTEQKMSAHVIESLNCSLFDRQIKREFQNFDFSKAKFCFQNLKIRWQNRGMAVRQVHGFPYVCVVT